MKKDRKIPHCGSLPDYRSQRVVVGAKQLRKALQNGHVKCVYLADNADPAITAPIEALCEEQNIRPIRVRTMQELGRACGIEVGAAAAAVVE